MDAFILKQKAVEKIMYHTRYVFHAGWVLQNEYFIPDFVVC